MRPVLHAHRDGKYVAIDNPGAVVIDYDARMIRAGLDRWPIRAQQHLRFLAFMLRSADLLQARRAIGEACGFPEMGSSRITDFVAASEPVLRGTGMLIETVHGVGYQLHSEPRETLPCCRNLAPGQTLPWRLRSTSAERGNPPMTCAGSLPRRMTSSARSSATR